MITKRIKFILLLVIVCFSVFSTISLTNIKTKYNEKHIIRENTINIFNTDNIVSEDLQITRKFENDTIDERLSKPIVVTLANNKSNLITTSLKNTLIYTDTNELYFIINEQQYDFVSKDIDSYEKIVNKFITKEQPVPVSTNKSAAGCNKNVYIPDSGTCAVLQHSSSQATVDAGYVGHMPWSGAIGVPGAGPVLAAHNGRGPFGGFGKLHAGSKIYITENGTTYTYTVTSTAIGWKVDNYASAMYINENTTLADATSFGQLIMYTCYPFNAGPSTLQRYYVFATLDQ